MDDGGLEKQLIEQAKQGDEQALERLLLAYYDRLAQRVSRRLPADLQGAVSEEDILQQTFIGVFHELGDFQPEGRWAFYRWLCTIAEHRLQDAIKANRAAKRGGGRAAAIVTAPSDSMADLIELLAGPRHTPSRSVARHEAIRAVEQGLTKISADYRNALRMRYVEDMPVADVAEAMGRTTRAVHNLCHKGLRELAAVMGESSLYLTRR